MGQAPLRSSREITLNTVLISDIQPRSDSRNIDTRGIMEFYVYMPYLEKRSLLEFRPVEDRRRRHTVTNENAPGPYF